MMKRTCVASQDWPEREGARRAYREYGQERRQCYGRFGPQPEGLARVFARRPRLSASAALGRRRGLGAPIFFASGGSGAVPANGPAANESRRPLVARFDNIRDIACAGLRVLSKNRDSAARVSSC